jgi:hypothetical protein
LPVNFALPNMRALVLAQHAHVGEKTLPGGIGARSPFATWSASQSMAPRT